MNIEVLTAELKDKLAKDIKLNGGEVKDDSFANLEIYLQMNPKEEVIKYLDN